ncbi:Meckel syndrome type 1 protein-like [Thrips palmi]|uniref:Meckel syndrome type 1 protein-like n=1 Tax=Thrips palmi TaxID=161013 RepID=A0A6P8ZJQ9_THRPL|nr:Meckel syndrome type 1 protein-like [Thrips palmi]
MTHGEERDAFTGIYKTNDPIQNLKIRVHLRHVKAAHIPLPQFVNEDQERDLDGASSASATASVTVSGTSQARGNSSDDEIKTFAWQEKVFSRYEIDLYNDISNCHTALQEQYHKEIRTITSVHRQNSQQDRLFTYVHNDDVSSIQEDEDTPTLSSEPHHNHLVIAMRQLQTKQRYVPRNIFRREKMRRRQVLVQEGQGNAEFHLQGLPQAACQRMYIMADLSSLNDVGANEYVLCVVRWNAASGSLFVSPDICGPPTESKPYRIEVDGDARNVYEYWLELASSDTSEEEKVREAELRSKVYRHQSDLRKARIGDDFCACQSGTLSVNIFGQINILQNFDDHNLFIHYFIDLPRGWSSDSEESLAGISASCKASNGCVHLGHPLQFNLKLSLSELEDSSDVVPRWPQLMFEVLSMDWWGRFRTEGYGYVTLPSTAGQHHVTTHTWRPIGNSPVSELRRFFIGGNPELEDITYVGIPHEHEGPLLGKYGVQTVPSGSVDTVFNVVLQSSSPSGRAMSTAPSALLERLSAATLVSSVNQVLAAFRRAHERMLAAKQGLDLKDLNDLKGTATETATDTQESVM